MLEREAEADRREAGERLGQKCMEAEGLKRALDEQAYENENLRRIVQAKQEEIGDLYRKLEIAAGEEEGLRNRIAELEQMVIETEEKNKKLVELLNASIYNKAEQYKEKVLSKLQERNPNATPNKY
eukprot:CAMPEP_0202960814 /NCGR_PEP_ID=MMETSP1396-20130829/4966_1 /ASSEMBLY_ACC=CAM_ASM_000872 /TAXON_ID= /ORGANISM="Pseudokeronopsis sp., Strain Brazil" /LENGTH=125 /DNA_ID=CAMNT_0049680275 /DNA_START=1130 /DNA_END=1507 /DNA_ORIENTATION=+